ncbi:MAG: nuclear transport factor 2 family protein [candidate division KSB1 bacterium]|nr:nuclear transport factor 2 family protein [candidate division KSB1 bacterium]MDZ7365848.1 nuclear transport factor 2 family protein [candidate division KSB1 bacterium]MDZ7403917.1 nuclear transport factor 2 family protein [candidate division KSB1 bacterium]
MNATYIIINILLIVLILVGGGYLARSRFRVMPKKDEKEIWKKNALNYNKQLDEAFQKKKEDDYKNLLHNDASRYQPRLPYRIKGPGEVMKWVKLDMEAATPSAISIVENDAKLYDQTVVITYHYMTQSKIGELYTQGVGKVTRIWVRVADGWKLAHEHISSG